MLDRVTMLLHICMNNNFIFVNLYKLLCKSLIKFLYCYIELFFNYTFMISTAPIQCVVNLIKSIELNNLTQENILI